ncbi:MAG: DNA repair protein RadC [Bacteroidales bacterium]|nr:DNA repair protein RadC [Bacteroidales bacterium]
MSIKKWSSQDRPREKLVEQGARSLTDAELLAILIGSGNTEKNAVELAREILHSADDDLFVLGKSTIDDFVSSFKGIGTAKAVTIVAALELGRRRKENENEKRRKSIKSSQNVFEILQPLIGDTPHEEFWVMYLNRSNRIISKQKLSSGGTTGTVVDEKLIIRTALLKYAESIILCHNHPSGNTVPSKADIQITEKIKNAASFFSIKLLDHIIIGGNNFSSFADDGRL